MEMEPQSLAIRPEAQQLNHQDKVTFTHDDDDNNDITDILNWFCTHSDGSDISLTLMSCVNESTEVDEVNTSSLLWTSTLGDNRSDSD